MRTLKQVATNMADAFTRFGLWKGGGNVVYGGIDVNNVIYELTNSVQGTEWVATEDCYFIGELVSDSTGCYLMIDNVPVAVNFNTSISSIYFPIFVLKGQTIKYFAINSNYIRTAKIYGVKKSEKIIHEYSMEEKVVGKWIDGKDIYEKVINVDSLNVGNNIINFDNLNDIISYTGFVTIGNAKRNFPYLQNGTVGKVVIDEYYNDRIIIISNWQCSNVSIIIQYTKT